MEMEYALDWMQQSIVESAYEQVVFNIRRDNCAFFLHVE